MLPESVLLKEQMVVRQRAVESLANLTERLVTCPIHVAERSGEEAVHVSVVLLDGQEMKGTEAVHELPVPHRLLLETATCGLLEQVCAGFVRQKSGGRTHVEAVPHLLVASVQRRRSRARRWSSLARSGTFESME